MRSFSCVIWIGLLFGAATGENDSEMAIDLSWLGERIYGVPDAETGKSLHF